MSKIHWLIYVIVGLFVSIASWRIYYNRFIIFFYIGLIFILIGIAKLIFSLMETKEKKETAHKPQDKAHAHQAQQFKYCTRCGAQLRIHNNFCSRCGARV